MFCTKCGNQLIAEAQFCSKCGAVTAADDPATIPQPQEIQQAPVQQPALGVPTPQPMPPSGKKNKKHKKNQTAAEQLAYKVKNFWSASIVLSVFIALFLVGIIGDIAWLVNFGALFFFAPIAYLITTISLALRYSKFKKSGEVPPPEVAKKITAGVIWRNLLIAHAVLILGFVLFAATPEGSPNDDIRFVQNFERFEGVTISQAVNKYMDSPEWSTERKSSSEVNVTIRGRLFGQDTEIVYNLDYTADRITLERVNFGSERISRDSLELFEKVLFIGYRNDYEYGTYSSFDELWEAHITLFFADFL
jgi:hypothetical protein